MQWGVAYAAALPVVRRLGTLPGGVGLAAVAFGASYVVLPALGVYKPIWEYDRDVIVKDATAHTAYGLTAAAVASALARG